MTIQDKIKEKAAQEAFDYILNLRNSIKNDILWIGIGSGTTIKFFINILGEAIKNNKVPFTVKTISSSIDSENKCRLWNLPIYRLEELEVDFKIDIYVDGADEVDPLKRSLKGLGGASTREKLLRINSKFFLILIDNSKQVEVLGQKTPVVCEILPFSYKNTLERLKTLDPNPSKIKLRSITGKLDPFVTDNGNFIADLYYENSVLKDHDLSELEIKIRCIPGVIESGLFSEPADLIVIASVNQIKILS